ncbi:MAG: hypothetical protein ACLGPL_05880 [Acidobacteriota bacterium]
MENREEANPRKGNGSGVSEGRHASDIYAQGEHAVAEAYDRTARAVKGSYDQAVSYGQENPAKLALITLGVGVGIGLLLSSVSRRSRRGRLVRPVIDTLYDIAQEFVR